MRNYVRIVVMLAVTLAIVKVVFNWPKGFLDNEVEQVRESFRPAGGRSPLSALPGYLDNQSVSNGAYNHFSLGFTFPVPEGWTVLSPSRHEQLRQEGPGWLVRELNRPPLGGSRRYLLLACLRPARPGGPAIGSAALLVFAEAIPMDGSLSTAVAVENASIARLQKEGRVLELGALSEAYRAGLHDLARSYCKTKYEPDDARSPESRWLEQITVSTIARGYAVSVVILAEDEAGAGEAFRAVRQLGFR